MKVKKDHIWLIEEMNMFLIEFFLGCGTSYGIAGAWIGYEGNQIPIGQSIAGGIDRRRGEGEDWTEIGSVY